MKQGELFDTGSAQLSYGQQRILDSPLTPVMVEIHERLTQYELRKNGLGPDSSNGSNGSTYPLTDNEG